MLVRVRRDGSLLVKFDGEVQLPLVIQVDGQTEEEKIQTLKNLLERVNNYGSVVATSYLLKDGEFVPVRRRNGKFEEVKEKNYTFLEKTEIVEILTDYAKKNEKFLKLLRAAIS